MSKKKSASDQISGIVLIVLFLALYYGYDKIEYFQQFDKTIRGVIILVGGLFIFGIVRLVFAISKGEDVKSTFITMAPIFAIALVFLGIVYLLRNTGVSEDLLFGMWFGIPVLLLLSQTQFAKNFISNLTGKKKNKTSDDE